MEDFKETKEQIRKRHLLMRNDMPREERLALSDIISIHAQKLIKLPQKNGHKVKIGRAHV